MPGRVVCPRRGYVPLWAGLGALPWILSAFSVCLPTPAAHAQSSAQSGTSIDDHPARVEDSESGRVANERWNIVGAAKGASGTARTHTVPLFLSAATDRTEGVLRIINRTAEAGEVTIDAFDDAGRRYGPLTLSIDGYATTHLTSTDLESGNADIGLAGATGSGQGDWRLVLTSDLEIEPLRYARVGGFFTTLNAVAPVADGMHRVATLNPGYNTNQVGRLRLANLTDGEAEATLRAVDGEGTPGGALTVNIPASGARTYTSTELESGNAQGLVGALGPAESKWRVTVETDQELVAMSLVSSPTGHLTNFSAAPSDGREDTHLVRLLPPASDARGRQGFVRVINGSDGAVEVSMTADDATAWEYDAVTLALGGKAATHFNTNDLEQGNESKGLSAGVGAGEGDWRLEFTSAEEIGVLSFVRTRRGFVTAMDGVAAEAEDGSHRYYLPFFHAADHTGQESRLRLGNAGDEEAAVTIRAMDDRGEGAPGGSVGLALDAEGTLTLTAGQLERGAEGLTGQLGEGSGSWQLFVAADRPLEVIGLGHADDGLLENLSRGVSGYRPWALAADLVVESFSASETSLLEDETFTLSATVHNRGDHESPPTTIRYYQSDDETIATSDTELESDALGKIPPGGSRDSTASLNAPTAGSYFYGTCVEAVGEETDATNNCSASVTVTVTTVAAGNPDLVVRSPTISEDNPEANETVTLSVVVENLGDAGAPQTTLRFYRSTDATITTTDSLVGTNSVGELAISGTSQESISFQAPSTPGRYNYGACIDGVSGESDTTNNCSSAVDLAVGSSSTFGAMLSDLIINEGVCEGAEAWFSVDHASLPDAEAAVLEVCRSNSAKPARCGGSGQGWFRQCAAVVFGSDAVGQDCGTSGGGGTTRTRAEKVALDACGIDFSNCRVEGAACNSIPASQTQAPDAGR